MEKMMSQDKSHPATQGVHPDEKQRDDAEAKMKAAPLATVSDLPEDHPIRRRQEMMEHIGEVAGTEGVLTTAAPAGEDDDADDAAAEAARAQLASDAARAEAAERAGKPAEKKPEATSEVATEIASQAADDASVLDLSALEGKSVRIKIDGVETLVPATKVLGQYQKGAAADVRLANATKAQREAEAEASRILAAARAATATQATAPAAQAKTENAEAAVAKFKEANEAIFVGEAEKAARLFAEGTALIQAPAATGQPFDSAQVVQEVARGVKAQLSQERALETLFTDYPEIKAKRAFQIVVDEAIAAKVANGLDTPTAIKEAGDEVAEEYRLGKFGAPAPAEEKGRQIKVASGTPTTAAAKRAGKDGLDNVQAGNARVASAAEVVETPQDTIAQMMAARAGNRAI
jgi:hypothetical protein